MIAGPSFAPNGCRRLRLVAPQKPAVVVDERRIQSPLASPTPSAAPAEDSVAVLFKINATMDEADRTTAALVGVHRLSAGSSVITFGFVASFTTSAEVGPAGVRSCRDV